MSVESAQEAGSGRAGGLRLRMLGALSLERDGMALALPASRKLRALLAYLALSPHAVGRGRLCEIFWDVPNDPRGELRWCLSKLRGLLDGDGRRRVVAEGDTVRLDLGDCAVDAIVVTRAVEAGLDRLDATRLTALAELFRGDFLDGLDVERCPHFEQWLAAQRRRCRACHAAVLEHLAAALPATSQTALAHREAWVALAPFDRNAHAALLDTLAARGHLAEGEAHLAAAARLFEGEELDPAPLREAWRDIRRRHATDGPARAVIDPRAASDAPPAPDAAAEPRRASLAVMPFVEETEAGSRRGGLADGLTHDVITRLAKLRNLFIIARGSVFALAERDVGPEDAARRLNVDYVASGTVRRQPGRILVNVEVVEARTARIVWADAFDQKLDDAFLVLDQIGDRIVSSIASEIETVERNRAILRPPNSLNAWEAYHRGLWHMYRFTRDDNDRAQDFFRRSIGLDPTFARAHAGLSFTHWQNAFQQWRERETEREKAYAAATQSLIVDEHDPSAHWAMGRALWLGGRLDDAMGELERAVDLSPNFALGHYAIAFVQAQSGDANAAIAEADRSRSLSPFDPLLFAILSARALAHVRLGQFEEAVEWSLRASARPNAHPTILAITAHCLALTGRLEEAQTFAAKVRQSHPGYKADDFIATFRFEPEAEARFRQGAQRIGLV